MASTTTAAIAEGAARRLKAAVEALNTEFTKVSYGKVADRAGINRTQFSELLGGKRTLSEEWAASLAPILGVSAEYLLGMPGGDAA